MSEKNIKKQQPNKALENDALENVSGGWRTRDATKLRISQAEADWLNDHGYTVSNLSSDSYGYIVCDSQGNELKASAVGGILLDAGFCGHTSHRCNGAFTNHSGTVQV